jgi:predicted transposase/invertase (TIGR01784 family)
MITDPLFYRLFATSPETFFLLLGMSAESARKMAGRYQFEAVEFKETSHRADGVFRPKEAGLPLYFLEVQFYRLPSVFADVLAKAYTYLKQHDPGHSFYAIVLFLSRSLEPQAIEPYRPLFEAGTVQRYYLDEIPELADAPLGLSILYLIRKSEEQAIPAARELIVRTRQEVADPALVAHLVELIETVIIYKLPRLSREEIQAMLQVDDIRKTRVYQEAQEEGRQEALLRTLAKLAAMKFAPEQIAEILDFDVDLVRKAMAKLGESTSPREANGNP